MKKLVLTIIALVAVATASFAQYVKFVSYTPLNLSSITSSSSYNAPSISYSAPVSIPSTSYSVPRVSYNAPSTVNLNTTSVSGYTKSNGTYVHGVGRIIQTGPRGGQYYNNSNGNKTYVPKRNLWWGKIRKLWTEQNYRQVLHQAMHSILFLHNFSLLLPYKRKMYDEYLTLN